MVMVVALPFSEQLFLFCVIFLVFLCPASLTHCLTMCLAHTEVPLAFDLDPEQVLAFTYSFHLSFQRVCGPR